MARGDHANGWAVLDNQGLNIRSVSPTRRGAIVNWLVVEVHLTIMNSHTDEQIDAMWDAHRGEAQVSRVFIQATDAFHAGGHRPQ